MRVFELKNISFQYDSRPILNNVCMDFKEGNIYSIIGSSGSGKTTLLSLMSGLTKLQEGTILYEDIDIKTMDMYNFRSHKIGMIFQSYYLLNKLTALENVILAMDIAHVHKEDKEAHAKELLAKLGFDEDQMNRRVLKLSGGQQQRVAIARALSYDPKIILADEPTGNLDPVTRDEIMAIFNDLKKQGKCIIIVTHSKEVADMSDKVYTLKPIQ